MSNPSAARRVPKARAAKRAFRHGTRKRTAGAMTEPERLRPTAKVSVADDAVHPPLVEFSTPPPPPSVAVRTSCYPRDGGMAVYCKSRWLRCKKCHRWRRVPCAAPFESMAGWCCHWVADAKGSKSCREPEEQLGSHEVLLTREEEAEGYEAERLDFYEHLASFMRRNRFPARRPPALGGSKLDLYRLYREVLYRGGYDSVAKTPGSWKRIMGSLNPVAVRHVPDAGHRLERYYTEALYAYEQHYFGGKPIAEIKAPMGTRTRKFKVDAKRKGAQGAVIAHHLMVASAWNAVAVRAVAAAPRVASAGVGGAAK